jgi:hypothetical protein
MQALRLAMAQAMELHLLHGTGHDKVEPFLKALARGT